jgi:hypothetical protein
MPEEFAQFVSIPITKAKAACFNRYVAKGRKDRQPRSLRCDWHQPLVPTLRVGTGGMDALRPARGDDGMRSVPNVRSHAERGNEKFLPLIPWQDRITQRYLFCGVDAGPGRSRKGP